MFQTLEQGLCAPGLNFLGSYSSLGTVFHGSQLPSCLHVLSTLYKWWNLLLSLHHPLVALYYVCATLVFSY